MYTVLSFPQHWARVQRNQGVAYRKLFLVGHRQTNLEEAIASFEKALQVFTREDFPLEWATTLSNLGNAYGSIDGTNLQISIKKAIACYKAVLQVRTRENMPLSWALTQLNLGAAYSRLKEGDRRVNLEKAMVSSEMALQVFISMRQDYYMKRALENLKTIKDEIRNLEPS